VPAASAARLARSLARVLTAVHRSVNPMPAPAASSVTRAYARDLTVLVVFHWTIEVVEREMEAALRH
jgi:hypothetical protein